MNIKNTNDPKYMLVDYCKLYPEYFINDDENYTSTTNRIKQVLRLRKAPFWILSYYIGLSPKLTKICTIDEIANTIANLRKFSKCKIAFMKIYPLKITQEEAQKENISYQIKDALETII